jgi:hypothetical protein
VLLSPAYAELAPIEEPAERLAESAAASSPQKQVQLDRLKSRKVMICTPSRVSIVELPLLTGAIL